MSTSTPDRKPNKASILSSEPGVGPPTLPNSFTSDYPPSEEPRALITAWEVELPLLRRIQLAYEAWINAKDALLIRKAAALYGVEYSTLRDRLKGAKSAAQR